MAYIINRSVAAALPIITLYGEDAQVIHNPRIRNVTTGAEMKVLTALNGAIDFIVINTEDGSVTDASGIDISSHIDLASTFLTLVPGENTLLYLSDEDPIDTGVFPEVPARFTVSYKTIYAS